ncbi:MAG: hypothetical protein ACERKD_04375 [Prolixibacteraceae bacterium]
MKQIKITIITLLSVIQLYGQTTLNFHPEMFDNLTTTKLSTNIMANKAGIPDPIFGFNGIASCSASNLALWQYAYQTLYEGDINTPTSPTPETIDNQIPDNANSEIKINAVYFKYNHLADNAISSGLVHLVDTLFYDGPNSGNPYMEKTCVTVSPMYSNEIPLDVTFRGGSIYGNLTGNIASATINFDDGNGYLTFAQNTQYNINYSSEGTYNITLRLTLTNSSVVYAKSELTVSDMPVPLKSTPLTGFHDDYPCEGHTPVIVPDEDFYHIITRIGDNNDAMIKVWYGKTPGGQPKTSLTKPVVIVDGFDPVPLESMDRSAEHIYFETNYNSSYPSQCNVEDPVENRMDITEGLIDRLRNRGYDVAIVDFEWGGNYIDENALTLQSCISYLNNLLAQNNSNEQLVVMGPSMGALISRIALSNMSNHNTKLYISFDGPHQGAYIPMPLQRFYGTTLDEINEKVKVISATTMENMGRHLLDFQVTVNGLITTYSPLTCPAAQQMLMYHYTNTTNGNAFAPTTDHTSLYNSITGAYPQNCMNVAISCGDGHGNNQSTFSNVTKGNDYLGYFNDSFIKCNIDYMELPDNGSVSPYLYINLYSNFLGLKLNYFEESYFSKTSSSAKSYEREPGGNFNSNNMVFGLLGETYDRYECFMPLRTAFDLSSGVSNNIFSEFGIPTGRNFTKNISPTKSPFDMLYVCNENRFHVLRGPQPEEGTASLPGLTQNMVDFAVFLIENSENIDGATQSEVYNMYDIFHNGGIQYCSQPFNVDFLENGVVSQSYNSTAVTISNANITGSDINVEVYSTQGITIGNNTTIGGGATFFAGIASCPAE